MAEIASVPAVHKTPPGSHQYVIVLNLKRKILSDDSSLKSRRIRCQVGARELHFVSEIDGFKFSLFSLPDRGYMLKLSGRLSNGEHDIR